MCLVDDPEICRAILESLPTGLCVLDMQKKFVIWSDGAERITGHRRHEVVGRSCIGEPLLHCDHPGCEFCSEECPVARAIKTSRPAETSGLIHHKAGYEVPVRIRAVPIHNQHGSIIGAVELFDAIEQSSSGESEDRLPRCVDEITGAATRAATQSHLLESHRNFSAGGIQFGVLLFRVEGLDRFRSAFGPEAASGLLRVVARTIESTLWRTDFIGRWTDDQFLVVLNGCREDALHSVRGRLSWRIANDSIEWWGERRSLPVSIGHAMAQSGEELSSILERVEKSLGTASAWRTCRPQDSPSGSS
jgi:diguanylate cyclase (GGDEF)-like protein/PAS domain S-box-containing protein